MFDGRGSTAGPTPTDDVRLNVAPAPRLRRSADRRSKYCGVPVFNSGLFDYSNDNMNIKRYTCYVKVKK